MSVQKQHSDAQKDPSDDQKDPSDETTRVERYLLANMYLSTRAHTHFGTDSLRILPQNT